MVDQAGARRKGKPHLDGNVLMCKVAIGYWLIFWAMNGLDKFFNRVDLGVFIWYGKDRTEQFAEYFDRIGVSKSLIDPIICFAGIWELIVAFPFLLTISCRLQEYNSARLHNLSSFGFFASAATLIAFSMFDVVAGDRAELREHGLYLILLLVCWNVTDKAHKSFCSSS